MHQANKSPNLNQQRAQLLTLGIGVFFFGSLKIIIFKNYFLGIVLILTGACFVFAERFYKQIGRPVYLSLLIILYPIGRIVSSIIKIAIYFFGIVIPSFTCQILRIKKIKIKWKNKNKIETMFSPGELFAPENFNNLS